MPLVSVIMLSYNHEKYLAESIESVLNQTCADLELIIIDDASKDNSREIIDSYRRKDPRVKPILHETNKGIAETVNDGLDAATGKFITITASDDLWMLNKLTEQLKIVEQNENLIVWSDMEIIDKDSRPTGELFLKMYNAEERAKNGSVFEDLLKGNYIPSQTFMFKRENLGNIRWDKNLKYLNDYKFAVDLARRYQFYFIDTPLVKYRLHGANSIYSDRPEWNLDIIKYCSELLKESSKELSNEIKCEILINIGRAYSLIGKNIISRYYLLRALSRRPFSVKCWIWFISNYKDNTKVSRFLWRANHYLQNLLKQR